MTAITLNLLAEEQQVQEERARDPFKILMAVGLTLVTVVVGSGSMLLVMQGQKKGELQRLETRWQELNHAGDKEGEFQSVRTLAEEIVALNHSRTLLAPQLAAVKDLIPSTVKLSAINFAVETANMATGGEDITGSKKSRPKQVERLVLRMEGVVYGSRPELELDQFLQTLRGTAAFGIGVDDIQLRSISRESAHNDKTDHGPASVTFIIECRYKEKEKR